MLLQKNYLKYFKLWIVFLSLVLFCSACGFKLRASFDFPQELHTLNVIGSDPVFRKKVIKTLTSTSINVSKNAPVTLNLQKLNFTRRVAAVDSSAKPSEYALKYQLDYQLFDQDDKPISSKQKVIVIRNYAFTPEDIAAKQGEERLLRQEMLNDIVIRLLRQLQGIPIDFPENNIEKTPEESTPQDT